MFVTGIPGCGATTAAACAGGGEARKRLSQPCAGAAGAGADGSEGRLEVFRGQDGEDADGERCREVDPLLRHLIGSAVGIVAGRTEQEGSPGDNAHHWHLVAIAKDGAWGGRRVDERAVVDGFAGRQRPDGVAVDVGRICNEAGRQVGVARLGRGEIRDPGEEFAPLAVFWVALPPGEVYGLVEREGDGNGAGLDDNRDELSSVLAVMGFRAYPVRRDGSRRPKD